MACDRCSNGHARACQMGAGARSLPTDKIAVSSGDGPLARRNDVAVSSKAHRAARLAPFEARVDECSVQALTLRGAAHRFRTWNNPGTNAWGHLAPRQCFGRLSKVRQASVGARANEDPIDRSAFNRIA